MTGFVGRDVWVGLGMLAFAVAFWLTADRIPTTFLDGVVTASTLPKALAIGMGALAILLVVQTLLARRAPSAQSPEAPAADEPRGLRAHGRAIGMLAIGVLYLVLLPVLGYVVTIALLLTAVAVYNGAYSWRVVLPFAVLGALFFHLVFGVVLDVPNPAGIWPSLL